MESNNKRDILMKCTFENIINNPNASTDDFELNMGFVINISSVGVTCGHTELTLSSELAINLKSAKKSDNDIVRDVFNSPTYKRLINKIKTIRLPITITNVKTIEEAVDKVKKMGYDITHAMVIDYDQTPPTITERSVP
jgi:cellulase/cellobiase CelA1